MFSHMEENIKKDIISLLKLTEQALNKKDEMALKELSNHTIHNASIFQDKDSITIAVVVYALFKVMNRISLVEPRIVTLINKAKQALQKNKTQQYEKLIKNLLNEISRIDKKMNLYIQKIINEAEIKKGSKLYEHGISLAQTANLLGISQWEMMKYIGNTNIADKFDENTDVMTRINHTRRLFNLK